MSTLIQTQAHGESWIPLRHALGSTWAEFQSQLHSRVARVLYWLSCPEGPGYTTLFITEHRSDVGLLRDFKYETIYSEVNRALIGEHLKYCKNPAEYVARRIGIDGDPETPSNVSCDVLYSGDYSSTKKDALAEVVKDLNMKEKKTRVPAFLHFISDG